MTSPPGSSARPAQSPDRRRVLNGLAAFAATPLVAHAQDQARPASAGFVAIGDWGRMGDKVQNAVAAAMADAAREIDSRFVLSVGDNFYPAGVTSVDDPHWKASFEDVYAASSLQTPWYVALGNHDYRGATHAQVDYSRISPRWRMPSKYFKVPGVEIGIPQLDIFVIDTTPLIGSEHERFQRLLRGRVTRHPAHRARTQMAWLAHELAKSEAPWKLVVGHHPIYSGAHGDSPELIALLTPLLETHGVQVYLNGHDHDLQHIRRGRTDYICTGAGSDVGAVVPIEGTRFCQGCAGFATFTLEADTLRLGFRDATGRSLYQAALPRVRA